MKVKWTGAEDITIRETVFPAGKPVTLEDENLFQKVMGIPGFEEVKRGRKAKPDDEDQQ